MVDLEKLTAKDGLSHLHIELDAIFVEPNSQDATFRFRIVSAEIHETEPLAVLSFEIQTTDESGLDGMCVRAYDGLIKALRQMLADAATLQEAHRKKG